LAEKVFTTPVPADSVKPSILCQSVPKVNLPLA
jgi:hypothetical protein